MTPAELQQFADISLASSFVGNTLPGYTDRNTDFGIILNGVFGCNNEFSYQLAVLNGDSGDSTRNIFSGNTDDNLAYGARVNWAFLGATGYEEGALRQNTCTWYGELGAWAYYQADRRDWSNLNTNPVIHFDTSTHLRLGADLQLGYGGLSFTGAFNYLDTQFENNELLGGGVAGNPGVGDYTGTAILLQAGYLFPCTAWEIAARFSTITLTEGATANGAAARPEVEGTLSEFGAAINYYLNGHGNKLTLDAAWITASDQVTAVGLNGLVDAYAGYAGFYQASNFANGQLAPAAGAAKSTDNDVLLIRFQWQLAL
jgi:hypothetical protein